MRHASAMIKPKYASQTPSILRGGFVAQINKKAIRQQPAIKHIRQARNIRVTSFPKRSRSVLWAFHWGSARTDICPQRLSISPRARPVHGCPSQASFCAWLLRLSIQWSASFPPPWLKIISKYRYKNIAKPYKMV